MRRLLLVLVLVCAGDRMSLLTNLAVVGVPANGLTVAFWQADGTLNGTIALPAPTFDQGAVVVSKDDNRIYVIVTSEITGCALLVYDETGTLLATTELGHNSYAIYVPESGKAWVAIEGDDTGEVWEYDSSGVFQSVVATLTAADSVYIQAAYGMARTGGFLYFNTLRGFASHDEAGVWKYDLAGGGDSVPVILSNLDVDRIQAMSLTPGDEKILITRQDGTDYDKAYQYNLLGVLQDTYTIPDTHLIGLAADPNGTHFWVGDENGSLVYRVEIASGDTESFTSLADSGSGDEACDSALCAVLARPIVDPPEADEDPCSIKTPLYFAVVQPSAELGDTLQGGQTPLRDPIDYYGGYKPPLVLSISAITRAASDLVTGSLPAQSASVVWADTTRALRTIFGTIRGDFTSSPLWIYLTSRVTRAARQIPRLLFYGFISDDPISQDLTYTTNANDLVGKGYSLLGDEVLIPKRTISDDHFPNRPQALIGAGVPIIGGDVSYGIVDNRAGAIKLIDLWDFECQDSIIRRALLVAGHTCKSITLYQGGEAIPSGDFGINAWAPGETGWTDIVPSGAPVVTIDGDDYALVFVSGKRALAIDSGSGAVVIATVASGASNVTFDVGSGEAAQFTAGDEIDIRLAANSNEPELRTIDTIVGDTITVTEALSGTPANGDTVRPSALPLGDAEDGFVYADVEGMTDDGTEGGALLEDLLPLDRHVLENFIFGDYRSGAWLPPPTFEFYPGGALSYLLARATWDAAHTVSESYLAGGYKGAFVIGAGGKRQSTRTVMADFARSGNFRRCWRGNNQMAVVMLDRDRTAFLGGRPTLTDRRDILSSPRFAPTVMKDWLCNDLTSRYAQSYREDSHGDWNGSVNHGNAPSKLTYGDKIKTETYPMVRDADTASTVNQQRIDFFAVLRSVWTAGLSLCGVKQAEMLTGVAVTHYGGKSAVGFVDNGMWVEKQTITPNKTPTVTVALVNVDDLLT